MEGIRKVTINLPADLLERAQESTGEGVTETVRLGLKLVSARKTYAKLKSLRGKVKFSVNLKDLRADRT